MTILTFIAIVPLIVVFTLLVLTWILRTPGPGIAAVLILVVWLIAVSSFNEGARWQHNHVLEHYNLTPLESLK